MPQVPPEFVYLGRGGGWWTGRNVVVDLGCSARVELAVTVPAEGSGPAARGAIIIPREGPIAVPVGIHRCGDAVEIVDDVLDLGLRDHFLALQDATQQQPDDHQHDRDFDQGEPGLSRVLVVASGCSHWNPHHNSGAKMPPNPQEMYPKISVDWAGNKPGMGFLFCIMHTCDGYLTLSLAFFPAVLPRSALPVVSVAHPGISIPPGP